MKSAVKMSKSERLESKAEVFKFNSSVKGIDFSDSSSAWTEARGVAKTVKAATVVSKGFRNRDINSLPVQLIYLRFKMAFINVIHF